jgi:hypothetical protein
MDEARTTDALGETASIRKCLSGKVVDIGAGKDPVFPCAERSDMDDRDANVIARFRPADGYDAAHSSRCPEHMRDTSARASPYPHDP